MAIIKLNLTIEVQKIDGPSIPADQLAELLAEEIDSELSTVWYLTGDDNDDETTYDLVSSKMSVARG